MSKTFLVILLIVMGFITRVQAQSAKETNMLQSLKLYKIRYGVKVGYNASQLTTSKTTFYSSARDGFSIGGFIEPPSNNTGFGFRSEIVFSRQGFSTYENSHRQLVTQDYVYLPEFVTFNFGKWVQLQAGLQIGYLLRADKENNKAAMNILPLYNRLDYGFAGGVEVNPGSRLIIGARYNGGLRNVFKNEQATGTQPVPGSFNPSGAKSRNSVAQLIVGYKI